METLVLVVSLVAMIPFVTAGFVALAVAAMPVMLVVLSWVEMAHPTDHAHHEPLLLPLPHPA